MISKDKQSYLTNYLNSIKYIIFSFIQFNDFSKVNFKKFGIHHNSVSFPFKILIIIIFKQFINKLHLLFYFYQKKKYTNNLEKQFNKKLNFNTSWFINNAWHWHNLFYKLSIYEKNNKILELGSFEGCSSVYFAENFKNSTITCVDMWQNNLQDKKFDLSKVEINFDKNTKKYLNIYKKYLAPWWFSPITFSTIKKMVTKI